MTEECTIVIINDSHDDLELYRRLLNKTSAFNYNILEAHNSHDGVMLIHTHNPQCVLLDFALPGKNGIDALKDIRNKFPNIAVIMLTNQGNEDIAVQVMKEGAQDYLIKSSITAATLHNTIQSSITSEHPKKEKNEIDNSIIRLLIIDDNEDDREHYRRSLLKIKSTKYHISEASNGDNGLDTIDHFHPHCILLDYSMPGRNGIEILKCIRSKHKHTPVILLTGQGNELIAVQAMKEGAQDYITKSRVTAESLHRIIKMSVEYCSLQKRVIKQHESLTLFTRALAHDLKEPIRMIRSFLNLIKKNQKLSVKSQLYFSYIMTAAVNMDRLIDMVQTYTQLDGGDHMITKEQVDCNDIINTVIINLQQQIAKHNGRITYNYLPIVHANRTQLIQVFQNIISNALHYCDKEIVQIEIDCAFDSEHITFSVRDNGPGINPKHGEKIFQPFKRFSNERSGTGLGLAICKKIIDYHGGKIWYESETERSTTFKFIIPNTIQTNTEKSIIQKTAIDFKQGPYTQEKTLANVLLIEDSDPDVELTRIILFEEDHMKFNLFTAANGEEAFRFLNDRNKPMPDLILLDINMPAMGGFDFLKLIRAEKQLSALPVIICSTSTYDKDIEHAQQLGVSGYISKPPTLKKIRPQLKAVKGISLLKTKEGVKLQKTIH